MNLFNERKHEKKIIYQRKKYNHDVPFCLKEVTHPGETHWEVF